MTDRTQIHDDATPDPMDRAIAVRLRRALNEQAARDESHQHTRGETMGTRTDFDALLERAQEDEATGSAPAELTSRTRRRWLVPVAAAAAAASVIGVVALQPWRHDGAPATPTGTATVPTPTTTATVAGTVPVYWLGDRQGRTYLYREYRTSTLPIPHPQGANRVYMALTEMFNQSPRNPGSYSPWTPRTDAQNRMTISENSQSLTVDLPREVLAKTITRAQAQAALQSVVFTATAAYGKNLPVTITVGGQPNATVWGVRLPDEMTRDAYAQAPIWVTEPLQGATVKAGPVTIKGVANVFEGNVVVEALDTNGTVVARNHGTAAMGSFKEYSTTLNLTTPGSYTIRAYSPDASGRTDRLFEVTRTVTVE